MIEFHIALTKQKLKLKWNHNNALLHIFRTNGKYDFHYTFHNMIVKYVSQKQGIVYIKKKKEGFFPQICIINFTISLNKLY